MKHATLLRIPSERGQASWLALAALAVIVAAGAWLYDFGKLNGVDELATTRIAKRDLLAELKSVDSERKDLQQQLAIQTRSEQIDQAAKIEVRGEMGALQSEILTLRKELALYRGIFSPKDVTPGLRVQKFQLVSVDPPGRFHFDLTLTQVIKNDRRAQGKVEIEILGDESGHTALLIFKEVGESSQALKFGFRYFQHLSGEIRLPNEFHPRAARVKAITQGKYQPDSIEKEFDWPVAAAGKAGE